MSESDGASAPPPGPTLSLGDVFEHIAQLHPTATQLSYNARQAATELWASVGELAKYGVFVSVVEGGTRPLHQPWPRMVYGADGQARVVADQDELDGLGEGWGDAPHGASPSSVASEGGVGR